MTSYPRSRQPSQHSQPNAIDVEIHYLRRDVDHTQRQTADLHQRVTVLEAKASFAEKLGKVLNTISKISWQMWLIIILLVLGVTGHISASDVKTYVEALKQ